MWCVFKSTPLISRFILGTHEDLIQTPKSFPCFHIVVYYIQQGLIGSYYIIVINLARFVKFVQ